VTAPATVPPRPGRLVLLGHPVAHSLSPAFQNAALAYAGIPLRYAALDVGAADLPAALETLIAQRGAGNVTIPYKERVAAACTTLTPVARRAGAVNTFWVADAGLVGDNTDVAAFHEVATALVGGVPDGARLALLGAGGAAAAVAIAVEHWPGARVRIWSRSPERAAALCARVPTVATVAATAIDAVRDATLVVNATPVGLGDAADGVPIDAGALAPGAVVLDLVYRPGETAWVRAARARGHAAADGLGMLIAQGALAFERWLGIVPNRRVMWDAVRPLAGPRPAH
jgi:shikimate dehydrogenase